MCLGTAFANTGQVCERGLQVLDHPLNDTTAIPIIQTCQPDRIMPYYTKVRKIRRPAQNINMDAS
jgi:hypothetical protein